MGEGDLAARSGASQGMEYNVDIVLCIDATQSMGPVIEAVKSKALQMPLDLLKKMDEKSKHVSALRIKVIAFRDIYVDAVPFQVSDFFLMPDGRADFEGFMRTVSAEGGGDEPESGLEALALAMNSDWSNDAVRSRHLVVMWTDASAHPIERNAGKVPAAFSSQIPSTMDEMIDMWEGAQKTKIAPKARRMVLFTPGAEPWTNLEADWDEVIHFPSEAGNGLADFEYGEILDLLVNSV